MINLKIQGHNFDLSDKVTVYVNEKIGCLDKYLPKRREQYFGTVVLSQDPSGREDNRFVCEARIEVAGPDLQSKEATINIFAAIDIVEAKLKAQAMKYKDKHSPRLARRRAWLNKLWGRGDSTEVS